MCHPFAVRHFHIRENRAEGRVLRAAGVDAKGYFPRCFVQVTDAHLMERLAIFRVLDTEIIFSAAQAVPHGFYMGGDFRGRPVGIAVIRHHAAQVLEVLVFVFNRTFQPVFAVQIQHNPTLVKAVMAFGKFGFYQKGKEGFFRIHLQYGRIIIAEMVIGSLPQIRVRFRDDFDSILRDHTTLWFPGPG